MVRALGPLVAVFGNVEEPAVRAALPATAEAEVAGLRIGVVHDGGPEAGRLERMRRRFPGVGGVVFGHSHIPLHEVGRRRLLHPQPGQPHRPAPLSRATAWPRSSWSTGRPPAVSLPRRGRPAGAAPRRSGAGNAQLGSPGWTCTSRSSAPPRRCRPPPAAPRPRWSPAAASAGSSTAARAPSASCCARASACVDLDLVLITHLHGDHYLGLPGPAEDLRPARARAAPADRRARAA